MPESLDMLLQRVTMQQQQIARARPLPGATLRALLDDFAHDTTALEGNTLTSHETPVVWELGITIGGNRFENTWKSRIAQRRGVRWTMGALC